jgi:hypothetical protein
MQYGVELATIQFHCSNSLYEALGTSTTLIWLSPLFHAYHRVKQTYNYDVGDAVGEEVASDIVVGSSYCARSEIYTLSAVYPKPSAQAFELDLASLSLAPDPDQSTVASSSICCLNDVIAIPSIGRSRPARRHSSAERAFSKQDNVTYPVIGHSVFGQYNHT